MTSRGHAAFVCAVLAVLLLPGRADPRPVAAAADGVSIGVSAPETAAVGAAFEYTITLTYNGELTGVTPEYTLTDALPSGLVLHSIGITAGDCPTKPAPGQNGTVSCVTRFAPQTKTVTITIGVRSSQTGAVTNTASLSDGQTASATTTITPLPLGGSTAVDVSGPDTITISPTVAPARFTYSLVFTYSGPQLVSTARTTFTAELPTLVGAAGLTSPEGIFDCVYPDSTKRGGTFSCTVEFNAQRRTVTAGLSVRPTGQLGTGTNTVTLSTGGSDSVTTAFVLEAAPPAAVAGPPAAPTQTVAETFTEPGQAEAQTTAVSPMAKTAQIALTWPDPGSSFDVTGIQLLTPGQALAVERLAITKKRTARSLDVRIKGLKRGKLRFKIVARKLHGKTRVVAKIRQSKR